MPWPFGKKKKKEKKFPDPPSFYEQREMAKKMVPKTPPPLSTPKQEVLEGPPRQQVFEGPPRQQELEGPPKHPGQGLTGPPNLPPPPPITGKVPVQPRQQPAKEPVPLFDDNLASEIHAELRQRDFGSAMKKAPERKAVSLSSDDLTKQHFRSAKQEYVEAGNKHLELNFFDNAATNFACAILCDLIGEGIEEARHTMLNLGSTVPSAVTENIFFDSVRLLLEAVRIKNHTFLTRAEKHIKKNMGHLYPEDVAMVEKALKTARAHFGY